MINQVVLIGRISSELNLRYTPNGNAVCNFNLAVNRPIRKDKEKETDFISCEVWGKQAENLVNYQNKGSLIATEGRYQVDKYQLEGETKYKHYILVSTIQFLESKKEQSQNSNEKSVNNTQNSNEDPFQQMHNQIEQEHTNFSEESLPF